LGKSVKEIINQIYKKEEYYKKIEKRGFKGKILLVGINRVKGKNNYLCIIEEFDKKKIKSKVHNKTYNNNKDDNDIVNNNRKRKQNQKNQAKYKKKLRNYY